MRLRKRWRQCPAVAEVGHIGTCCTREKGHGGQHHNVITQLAWEVITRAKTVPYLPERRDAPYQGQHDHPHDEATCGRCLWLRSQDADYRYHPDREPVTREDIDNAMETAMKRLTGKRLGREREVR